MVVGPEIEYHLQRLRRQSQLCQIDPAAIQIISLDFERYGGTAGSAPFRDWFAGRLKALRGMTERPIVVSNWPSEERQAEGSISNWKRLPACLPSVFVWDMVEIFRNMNGRFFDERAAGGKGTRLSNSACIEMARSLGLVRLPSVLLPRIKAIAVDLDNTLYDGVLGEDGVEGVRVSAEHEAIYKELLRLRDEGVFLAVLSKNDERDFIELCEERTDFLLKPAHFSASSIGWHPKPEELGVSPNSYVSALIRFLSLTTMWAKLHSSARLMRNAFAALAESRANSILAAALSGA